MLRWLRSLALGVGACVAVLGSAHAEDAVHQIVVDGIQRIEAETVRTYLTIQPGEPFDQEKLDRSLKNLFNTGLFADVTMRREGDDLIIRVVENPIINRLAFEGNRRLKAEQLEQEVQLRPRVVYTRTKVQADVKRILDLYRRSGRFAATVEPKVIQLPQNRVDLVFEINEGALTGIRNIYFVGNRHFSESKLHETVSTKESRWYRFLSSDDTYDPDHLTYDRELLRKFYLKRGYADFRVVSAVAELTPDRQDFFITFTLDEGERYKVRKVEVASHLPDVKPEDLRPQVATVEGSWYNADEVEKSVNSLTDAVGSKGYAFVDIRPNVNRDRDNHTIDIAYEIQEGPRVYVERIDIQGNVRTLDKVIRREFRLVEGDAFNASKLRRSRQRLQNLGFFEKVDINNVPSDAPDKTIVTVDVVEKSTGELSLGAGYSTTNGLLADVGMRERNLLGKGQDLRLNFAISQRQQNADLSFTEPYFLDREVAAGFDLFHTATNRQRQSGYDEKKTGGALRSGYQITEALRESWKYTLRKDSITNVRTGASRLVVESAGDTLVSSVGEMLLYDRRDSRTDPTDGWFASLSHDLAGFGGDARYLRNNVGAGYYWPLGEQWVGSVTGSAGIITGISKDVRITDRYFLGGDNLRGFAAGGVGPRDSGTGDALGGNWMYVASAEMSFPIGLPNELGIYGKAFTDWGSAGAVDSASGTAGIDDSGSLRGSVGVGLGWRSPMGPISVDLAQPVMKEAFDKKELFRVSFGTRF